MSLLESPSLQPIYASAKTSSLSAQSYVLSLTSVGNQYAASASAPSNTIHLFDKSSLQEIHTLPGHSTATTYLRTAKALAGSYHETLLSSGKDGCVKAWDHRSGSASIKMSTSGRSRALLSCDVSSDGLTVAAGTDLQAEDALILYWDPRNPVAPLRTHGSTHSDDITAVHFAKHDISPFRNVLLSASSDGLISTSDADEEDEDEAVLSIGNWGCSISQAGWIQSPSDIRAWAASDMETFSCWSNELDLLQDQDIRGPSIHNIERTWVTDYLITCLSSHRSNGQLGVFVGSNEGDVALISSNDLSNSSSPWSLHGLWTGGHVGVVRSLLWDEQNSVIVTGGEDSKINLWSCPFLEDFGLASEIKQEGDVDMEVEMGLGARSPSSRKREWDVRMNVDDEQLGKRVRR
ncbi:hypothetical protein SERLA73DRAFT_176815 [Serpula lacrymans var. lacrymans S7.3]|uniref:Uncharacterized protein n=2 Tax=Serpula lacrymans var. lacrymans TaxID=341189 RepID=F8PQ47_SERL3|nr:uncharacterized protein SERLADRAFT_460090 [Serpula lacrymans var. lacrymans S7.9]EGO01512.1 hypothetical protein SERLA73DRAFT_176815 [Serpula lacrymans var. lacrymans S7.3]EGO27166.1 hypothetical protein SERLADRAFT_460090 [Serpula lacrymans var. lacrymans S7.9]